MTDFIKKVEDGELKEHSVSINETHTATAQVGKNTIEAEYFIFDHSDWFGINKPKWTLWDRISMPFWKAKRWIIDTYWGVRYGFQRMFKGYDAVDRFETFAKFIDRYSKILTEYRKYHVGYCGWMTEEEWDAVIDEMIYHLKYMDEMTVIEELEKDVPDNWSASYKTVGEILDKHKNEFFELFSKYFYHLWD